MIYLQVRDIVDFMKNDAIKSDDWLHLENMLAVVSDIVG